MGLLHCIITYDKVLSGVFKTDPYLWLCRIIYTRWNTRTSTNCYQWVICCGSIIAKTAHCSDIRYTSIHYRCYNLIKQLLKCTINSQLGWKANTPNSSLTLLLRDKLLNIFLKVFVTLSTTSIGAVLFWRLNDTEMAAKRDAKIEKLKYLMTVVYSWTFNSLKFSSLICDSTCDSKNVCAYR